MPDYIPLGLTFLLHAGPLSTCHTYNYLRLSLTTRTCLKTQQARCTGELPIPMRGRTLTRWLMGLVYNSPVSSLSLCGITLICNSLLISTLSYCDHTWVIHNANLLANPCDWPPTFCCLVLLFPYMHLDLCLKIYFLEIFKLRHRVRDHWSVTVFITKESLWFKEVTLWMVENFWILFSFHRPGCPYVSYTPTL